MTKRPRWRVVIVLLVALSLLPTRAAAEPRPLVGPPIVGGPVAYAPATGHHLVGAFLTIWRARGGLTAFGYPLSELSRAGDGRWVQVTERALLSLPAGAQPLQVSQASLVMIEPLGEELTAGRLDEPAFQRVPAPADSAVLYFPLTGHTLANGFRAHWQEYDGAATLGRPLSEEFAEAGLIVQWFERGRLEFHPDSGLVQRSALSRLAPRAARLISPAVLPAANALGLESLPSLPSLSRVAGWSAGGFGLGEAASSVLAPIGRDRPLPGALPPADLIPAADSGLVSGLAMIRQLVLRDLQEMAAAAAERQIQLTVLSGYRSISYQTLVFEREVHYQRLRGLSEEAARREARRHIAQPGESEHHLGTVIDFNRLHESFGSTPAGQFLVEEGWRYGFLLSYPAGAEGRTGYVYEPWHLRWVGKPLAAAIHADGYLANGQWTPEQATVLDYLEAIAVLLPPSSPPPLVTTSLGVSEP